MLYDANALRGGMKRLNPDALERATALHNFERALSKGRGKRMRARLTGQSRQLLPLAEMFCGDVPRDGRYGGTQVVPLDKIRGTENRSGEFDIDFNPVEEHIEQRWVGVATAILKGVALPPVELIQVGETYFVRDGHHRISVAHANGQREIDAVVTILEV